MVWANNGTIHRPTVVGCQGAVASAHPLASLVGLNILQQGGNAIDAAVAIASMLNVVEPYMSGAGGVGYMTIRVADQAEPVVLDYMGHAPAAAELQRFDNQESNERGVLSSMVPGAVGGWLTALERFGTMDRATVFAPTIHYAEQGFPVTVKNHWFMEGARDRLLDWQTSRETYLGANGEAPRAGEVFKQENLARTYRMIVEGGAEAFYKGPIGEEIVRFSEANGGLLTEEDLATYSPTWQEPISITYRGYDVYCPAPPCSGIEYFLTLKLVEGFDMAAMGQDSPDYIHHLAEAMKLALADRIAYTAVPVSPVDELLSDGYISQRRELIDKESAGYSGGERFSRTRSPNEILPGSVQSILRECTTHFVTIDASGNAVACTQSLGSGFGSGVVYGNTGISLNNIANWFDLDPESPNCIAPNKKIEMPMSPSQVWKDGRLFLMVGTPGSFGIMQTTPQMIMNVLDHGFGIQAAIEAPRFRTGNGTEVFMEGRMPAETVERLRERGHDIRLLDPWTPFFGGGQGILVDPDSGAFFAGADPRRDGYSLAY